jgi:hypothetical protein
MGRSHFRHSIPHDELWSVIALVAIGVALIVLESNRAGICCQFVGSHSAKMRPPSHLEASQSPGYAKPK